MTRLLSLIWRSIAGLWTQRQPPSPTAPPGPAAIPRSTDVSTFKDWLAEASKTMTAVEHAAMHLVSAVANGDANLAALSTDHPLIAEAIAAGTAAATAHGIPVLTIEQTVIALAKEMSAALGSTETVAPAA